MTDILLCVKAGIPRRRHGHVTDTDTDILADILAKIVARMSACRSACHRNNFRKSRVSDVSARILARMSVSVSVSASWNASFSPLCYAVEFTDFVSGRTMNCCGPKSEGAKTRFRSLLVIGAAYSSIVSLGLGGTVVDAP